VESPLSKITSKLSSPRALLTIVTILVLINYVVPSLISLHGLSAYMFPAVLWLMIFAILAPFALSYRAPYARESLDSIPMLLLLSVLSNIVLALIFGFGINVNVAVPSLGLTNIIRSIPVSLGISALIVSVLYLPRNPRNANVLKLILLVSLVIMEVSIRKYITILSLGVDGVFRFVMGRILPTFTLMLLILKIGELGGFKALLFTIIGLKILEYAMPIIPSAPWYARNLVSMVIPLIQYVVYLDGLGMIREPRNRIISGKGYRRHLFEVSLIVLAAVITLAMIMGYSMFIVISGSMVPTLHRGDIIVVHKVSIDNIRAGDIIAFYGMGGIVTHRVYKIEIKDSEKIFVTKGDANLAPDPEPVKPENVIGKVAFVIPFIGLPLIFLAVVLGENYVNALMLISVVSILYYFASLTRYER